MGKPNERPDIKSLNTKITKLNQEISRLSKKLEVLSTEKKMLDEILDNLPGTFFIWDERPQLIRWNRRHEEITEYSGDEYPDMLPTDFFGKEEHRKIEAAVEKTFTKGEVTIEATLLTKSGKKIPHVYTGVRTTIDQKPVLMGFGIDISERKSAERRLQKAYSEIKALKNQLEADFTYLHEEINQAHDYSQIIGDSEVMQYVLFRVQQVAPTDTTILIQGETGTGKELIARAIHNASQRRERPLIKVDCASLPTQLIESELFGHEKGAFTHALEKRVGRFELANGATLFLDEIGELPLELQAKLLRVLQDGEFERLGSSKTIHSDVRVIVATNRDLEAEVRAKKFRMDLLYRLNVFTISLPPLRERGDDIRQLAEHMTRKISRKLGKRIQSIPSATIRQLREHSWPGNVRELENVIERAVINTQSSRLQLDAAPLITTSVATPTIGNPIKPLKEVERDHILLALKQANWKLHGKDGAAALLDINPSTLRGRMRKHGIQRPSPAD